jgi:glycosyltransferase involved in cell wall biosynthesis
MRVAFVPVWDSNPYHRELSTALRKHGVEVERRASLKQFLEEVRSGPGGVDVLHLHATPNASLTPRRIARYARFHARLAAIRRAGIAVVRTVHDLHNHDSKLWRLELLVNRALAQRLDGLIVHGETARERVLSAWRVPDPRLVHVIPHGNYIQCYPNTVDREAARSALQLDPSLFVFLFLGIIRPYKGVIEMIEEFRSVAEPRARLLIAGRPADEAIRRQVERAHQSDGRVVFLPERVDDRAIQTFMNAANVVVLPHRRVFTSGAAILAASFGKACIAPRGTPVADAIGSEGALFFDPETPGDLARAFERALVQDRDLAAMGGHNQRRVADWDWDRVGRMTTEAYAMALRERSLRLGEMAESLP